MSDDEKLRVLLVDDDASVLRVYEGQLLRHGVLVDTASDGKLATARVKTTSYDVIVSDISMPT